MGTPLAIGLIGAIAGLSMPQHARVAEAMVARAEAAGQPDGRLEQLLV